MNLLKTSFYTSIATAFSFISGFIVTKVVAVQIGPSGIAYLGQFQNTVAILTMFATGAIATGVVKYLAEYKNDENKRSQIINTASVIVLVCSFVVSLLVLVASGYISEVVFKTSEFWIVYILLGIFLTTIAFNVIFSSILNGLSQIRWYTVVNISGSILGIGLTVMFAYYFGVKGVLISGTALSLLIFLIHLFILKKTGIPWRPDFKKFDRSILKMLFSFSVMALTSGLLIPAIQILVRDKIINDFSIVEAGYWQAVTKISDYYLSFITLVLGVYYMPKLSSIKDRLELRKEILKAYKIVFPIVTIIAFIIWLLRDLIIQVLFSSSFQPMKPLFTFQLLGDVLKIGSWLIANMMLAKVMTKTYILTEICFAISYVVLCFFMIDIYGVKGATYGFCINYGVYWIVMALIMKKRI